jgi:catechol-2,3-dioxygenase
MTRIKPQKFVHVVYRTRRFDEMVRWYQLVFDATVQYKNAALAFLTYDDEHHRIALANLSVFAPEGNGSRIPMGVGVDHVAYTFASLRDLAENYAQLKELGIRPYWCLHHGITVSMYYGDPDGNQMEFQVDSFATVEAANEYMRGKSYELNPLGVEFDPDELVAKLRAGASESEFLNRKVDLPVAAVRMAPVASST